MIETGVRNAKNGLERRRAGLTNGYDDGMIDDCNID
jgi:hypothetical protein